MYLKLIRKPADGLSVRGVLYRVHFLEMGYGRHDEQLTKICDTLENRDYLILPLVYRVMVTMSPRFQRLLPILCDVPRGQSQGFRSGIRIHRGSRPEHSEGCVLVPGSDIESYLTDMLLACQRAGEEVRLEISNA